MDKQEPDTTSNPSHVSCGAPFPSKTEPAADDREMAEGHKINGTVQCEEKRLHNYSNWHPPQHKQ